VTEKRRFDWDYLRDPEFRRDPHAALERLRGRGTFWTDQNRGHWVVTDPDLTLEVLRDSESFSSRDVNIPQSPRRRKMVPVEVDPPDHGRYRTLLAPLFSPLAAAAMEPQLREYSTSLIERIVTRRSCEFVADYASQLPAILFLGLFDLPISDAPVLDTKIKAMGLRIPGEDPRAAAAWVFDYAGSVVDARIRAPGTDLISQLIASDVGDREATREEVVDILYLLLVAGLDTTTAVLAFGWRHLAAHPDDRARVVADPAVAPIIVEEILRHYSVANIIRVAARDHRLGDAEIAEGESVLTLPTLLHRLGDETDGVRVDLGPRRHYAFGAGLHRCLGSHLARQELAVAMTTWHEQIPEYHLVDTGAEAGWGGSILGLERLELAW